jgi:hypothetical protein
VHKNKKILEKRGGKPEFFLSEEAIEKIRRSEEQDKIKVDVPTEELVD